MTMTAYRFDCIVIEQRETFDQIAPGWYNFRHWTIFRAELEAMSKRWQTGKLVNLGCGHGADFLPFTEYEKGSLPLSQRGTKGDLTPATERIPLNESARKQSVVILSKAKNPSPRYEKTDSSVAPLLQNDNFVQPQGTPSSKSMFELYGVDFSAGMLSLAQKYARKFKFEVNLTQADVAHLPYQDASFDWAISVATFHHLQSSQERLNAFLELHRVLKPGGEAFITVWNRWQPRFWFKGKETLVPWRTQGKKLQRYYYLFTYAEAERNAKKAGLTVLRSFPESSHKFPLNVFSQNICLLLKK